MFFCTASSCWLIWGAIAGIGFAGCAPPTSRNVTTGCTGDADVMPRSAPQTELHIALRLWSLSGPARRQARGAEPE